MTVSMPPDWFDNDGRLKEEHLNAWTRDATAGDSDTVSWSSSIVVALIKEMDALREDIKTLDEAWIGATHPLVDDEEGIAFLQVVRPTIIARAVR